MEVFFTANEISEKLKVSPVWIYKLVRDGKIPYFRIAGKSIRFKEAEIQAWLEEGRGKRYYRDKSRDVPRQEKDLVGDQSGSEGTQISNN